MAAIPRQTKYCSNYSSFKIVQQPYTLAINAAIIMATILQNISSHIYICFIKLVHEQCVIVIGSNIV